MFFTLWKNLLNLSSILCYLHLCWWYFTAHYILWNYTTNSVSPVPLTDRESMANMKMVLICTQWWAIYTECISTALLKSQDSLLVERRNRDRKVVSSNPGRSGGRIFFSRVSCVCWLLFGVHSNPLVTAVACKRPKPFCQKCRWQVIHKKSIHPWPNEVGEGRQCRCPGLLWEPIRKRAHTQLLREHSVTVVSAC